MIRVICNSDGYFLLGVSNESEDADKDYRKDETEDESGRIAGLGTKRIPGKGKISPELVGFFRNFIFY